MAKEKSYTAENLEEAVLLVRNKSLTAYQAQKRYNISKTTFHSKIKGSHGKKYGSEIELSVGLENQLVDWLCMCAAAGSPKTTKEILEAAEDLASLVGRKFKGGIPSSGWLKGFMDRQPKKKIAEDHKEGENAKLERNKKLSELKEKLLAETEALKSTRNQLKNLEVKAAEERKKVAAKRKDIALSKKLQSKQLIPPEPPISEPPRTRRKLI